MADRLHHFRDPCVHCGLRMEDVAIGPCLGDRTKAVPMAWKSLGVRWDNVEHFLIQFSDGHFEHRWEHIEADLAYGYLAKARFVPDLKEPNNG